MVAFLKKNSTPTLQEFQAALSRCGGRWYTVCLRITKNPSWAEDAVQDALMIAWSKRDQYQGSAQLDTWMHRIVVNAALQLLRRQRPQLYESLEDDTATDGYTPVDARAEQEMGTELTLALKSLSELERVCFVLKHIEQWSLNEIAEELGTGVSNIKQGLFRAVQKLRVSMAHWRSEQ